MISNKYLLVLLLLLTSVSPAIAHFGMVIPSANIVTQEEKTVQLQLSFSHPFELIGMDMERPKKFYVVEERKSTDLLPTLTQGEIMGHQGWLSTMKVRRPGVYQFVMEPTPYWEAAEDLFIIHYTKTIVAAFGYDDGWAEPVGLPVEIVPLLRPYGNYAGNTICGQVLINGKPAANSEVEVEYYNRDKRLTPPSEYHVTQVIKTDYNGNFHFSCPLEGWWGFSALHLADYKIAGPDGEKKMVELGGVLWVYLNALDFNTTQRTAEQ